MHSFEWAPSPSDAKIINLKTMREIPRSRKPALTAETVLAILEAEGQYKDIAQAFGVSPPTVGRIKCGRHALSPARMPKKP